MSSVVAEALALVVCAAVMNAAYALPMKLNRKWQWEHTWFAFSLLGVAVVPTVIAIFTVPSLWSTYAAVSGTTLAAMCLFGAGWGVSMVFFGLALTRLGLAITFAVSLGTSAAVGALTPLFSQHLDRVTSREGMIVLAGVALILLGVAICGLAGRQRERVLNKSANTRADGFWSGYAFAFISGVLGSMLNLGLAFGGSIQQAARAHGASIAMMSNAVWLPCLYAGFLPGVIYCYLLMRKHKTTSDLRLPGTWYYWLASALMGLLWFGSIMLYSVATVKLGDLGTSIGWPLFLAAIVVASTFFGFTAGEWKRTGRGPVAIMLAGIACLVLAIAILSTAGKSSSTETQARQAVSTDSLQLD